MSQYEPLYDSFDRSGRDRYVPTSRMNVSSSVYLPGSEVDLITGQLKPDRCRRRRTQGMRLELDELSKKDSAISGAVKREVSKGGVRVPVNIGILLIGVLLFVCGLAVLMQHGTIAERQKAINKLESDIADCRSRNGVIEAQIAEASDAATICYAAARNLNMIPAESAEAIHLVAVDTRPGQTAANQSADKPIVEAQAESTHVPVVASN